MSTGNPYRHVRPGDPIKIPAGLYNDMIDTTAWAKAQRQQGGDGGHEPTGLPAGLVYARNDTGADLARFAVVALGAALLDPATTDQFFDAIALAADVPAADGADFAILLEPLEPDAIGRAAVAGVIPVQVAIADAAHTRAMAAAATTATLQSVSDANAIGKATVPLLWKQAGTGTKWALAIMPAAAIPSPDLVELTVVTDVQWNSSDGTLEKKTRVIRVPEADAESGWTDLTAAYFDCE